MRDPARIDRILRKLRVIWKASPDIRLGQLLFHLIRRCAVLQIVEDSVIENLIDEAATERVSAVDLLGEITDDGEWLTRDEA